MPQKSKTDGELWNALAALDDDLLDPNLPEGNVEAELREMGVDPLALAKRGTDFVSRLQEQERLSWQTRAREKGARMEAMAARVGAVVGLGRAAILQRIEELRSAGSTSDHAVAAAFRKRKPEESSDDELRALLEDMEALRAIEDEESET